MSSIRRQLTRNLFAAGSLLLIGGFASSWLLLRHELYRQLDERLRTAAGMIAVELAEDESPLTAAFAQAEGLELERAQVVPRYWAVVDEDGASIAQSARFALVDWREHRDPAVWSQWLEGAHLRFLSLEGRTSEPRHFTVVVAADQRELDEVLARITLAGVVTLGLFLMLAFWGVRRILGRGLAPLDAFGAQLGNLGADSLEVQFDPARFPTELRPMVSQFNALFARLAISFERERRVNADLAHELRTPLAELRLLAESSLKWPDQRDADTDRESLASIRQMETLVERMLLLARGEQGQSEALSHVDLAALVNSIWQPLRDEAEAKGLVVTLDLPAVSVESDPILLRAILSNLLHNALAYGAASGVLTVRSRDEGSGTVAVDVVNTVADLAPEDVEHMFERYWRKSLAREGEDLHVGLGLTIVQRFAEELGYKVNASLKEDLLTVTLSGLKAGD